MQRYLTTLSLTLSLFATTALANAAEVNYPLHMENCGQTLQLDAPAKRIFLVNNSDIALLSELDALDRVIARTNEPMPGIYEADVYDQLANIPLIQTTTNATGGAVISLESILAAEPDLVLAPENAVDRQLLAQAGIALYSAPAFCDTSTRAADEVADFDWVYEQLTTFGALLDKPALATDRIHQLEQDVANLAADLPAQSPSAIALYVSRGGKVLSPYGAFSMVTPVFRAAGLNNLYSDEPQRVFDANVEDILALDPDYIVILHSSTTPQSVVDDFLSIPAVQSLSAVQQHRVTALAFPFTDPPTPLSIRGADVLAGQIAELP